jgi:hypothetical protein
MKTDLMFVLPGMVVNIVMAPGVPSWPRADAAWKPARLLHSVARRMNDPRESGTPGYVTERRADE